MAKRRYCDLTEKITRKLLYSRITINYSITLIVILILFHNSYAALIDRTIAIIGDEVLTYREIQKIFVVSRLADGSKVTLFKDELSEKDYENARDYAIKTEIVKAYLNRIALKSPSEEFESRKVYDKIKDSFKKDRFKRFLDFYEIDQTSILSIIKDKLIMERFFSRAALLSENVSDSEVKEYYDKEKEGKFYGSPYNDIKEHIRKYLKNRKRQERINAWLNEQKRQIKVRIFR